jgi:hypothetical protein
MIRAMAAAIAGAFLVACAVMPVSYVPTTGKVGSQSGKDCAFKLFGIIPFENETSLLADAADAAGNPTKDVAVIVSSQYWVIGTNSCVTVFGSK